ncbi:UDP-glycosyltransferase [Ladona fulva]|uniref:UDP-glycosyltransferase n=1 Tax=Ladona fulva TaxID=123851 RepID=A0A8K0NXN5_LADFU|nr:UDP-glycosyltransferase [Ladona fulva]
MMLEGRSRNATGWLRLIALLVFLVHSTSGARILMVTLGGTKSHKIPFLELGRGMTRRGHSVTLMSAFPPSESPLPQEPSPQVRRLMLSGGHVAHFSNNTFSTTLPASSSAVKFSSYSNAGFLSAPPPAGEPANPIEEVAPPRLVQYVRKFNEWDLLGRRLEGRSTFQVTEAVQYASESCRMFLTSPEIRSIIQDPSESFDLLIADGAFPECALGFAHRFRIPFMYINTVGFHVVSIAASGSPIPYSVTPFFSEPYTENMSFGQRVVNTALHAAAYLSHILLVDFALQRIVREAFGPDVPNILDQYANVSFVLQNAHASVSYARPYLPLVAEIACIHCKPPKPLPKSLTPRVFLSRNFKDLEEFVSGGPEGFIFFSMGSSVKASNMPPQLRRAFMDAFARLAPIRVLWKWEEFGTDIPPNVKLGRWLPQQDILGHPRIRGFVTHGGLLSMFETVFHRVPVVTMPVFCDHDSNAAKAEMDGYAIKLELRELTADKLLKAIRRIIYEPQFRENVEKRSLLLRDQPETPLERAIYWTEYVIRHGGAPHLQSPAKDMNAIQTLSLDVAAFYIFVLIALAIVPVYLFRKIRPLVHVLVSRRMKSFQQLVSPVKQKVK